MDPNTAMGLFTLALIVLVFVAQGISALGEALQRYEASEEDLELIRRLKELLSRLKFPKRVRTRGTRGFSPVELTPEDLLNSLLMGTSTRVKGLNNPSTTAPRRDSQPDDFAGGPPTADELDKLRRCWELYAKSGHETRSIMEAFTVKKGSSPEYKRARWLFKTVQRTRSA